MVVLTLLVLLIFILFIYWCYGIYRKNKLLDKLPGPTPIPFFGVKLATDIYELKLMFDQLTAKYGKTFKLYVGGTFKVVTCDADLVGDIMKSDTNLKKPGFYYFLRPFLNDGLIVSHGSKWTKRRKLCTPSFHISNLKNYFEIFKESTDILVRNLGEHAKKGATINVMDFISKFSFDVSGESSFDTKMNTQEGGSEVYIHAVNEFMEIIQLRNFSLLQQFDLLFKFTKNYTRQEAAMKILNSAASKIIKHKRMDLENNQNQNIKDGNNSKKLILINALLQNPQLSDDDVLEEVNNFLFGGYDTTSKAISFALYELSQNLDIQEKLYEEINSFETDITEITMDKLHEMKYLDCFVKEVLRIRDPVPIIERELQEDMLSGGVLYPKGTIITMLLYWLHHSSDYYSNPEHFNPERFVPENAAKLHPFAFVPFSAGPRNCIGQKFAIIEIKTVLIRLIMEFKLLPAEDFKLELGMSAVLRSKNGYQIKIQRRTQH